MIFSLDSIAHEYIYKRYSNASIAEKEKYVNDWLTKVETSKKVVSDFIQRVGDVSGKKIIDVGCGNGGICIAFSLAGASVAGVEVEEDLYLIAKKHTEFYGAKVNFYLYDGNELPFDDNTFDYAVSTSVLEHTTSPVLYLREILRILKSHGILYLGFPNKLWPKETHTGLWFLTYFPGILKPVFIKMFHRNPLEDNNLHFYSYGDLEGMINEISDGKYKWEIIPESGKSASSMKIFVKKIMTFLGISYKTFLPHIMVLLRKVD